MKKFKIIFWTTTSIIFLFEGVMTALTSQTQMAIDGVTHLGYPVYFVTLIGVFKVLGTLALIIPQVPGRVKEWAYAGFGIDFISASVSIAVVDGLGFGAFFPLIFLGLLVASYVSYHKLHDAPVGM
ncbi:MAG TPA: DoxX family protein [Candidatus Paceibacterota bacterium]|nr:DoxX family protein [Candidatus Paceibacterota bacterium]